MRPWQGSSRRIHDLRGRGGWRYKSLEPRRQSSGISRSGCPTGYACRRCEGRDPPPVFHTLFPSYFCSGPSDPRLHRMPRNRQRVERKSTSNRRRCGRLHLKPSCEPRIRVKSCSYRDRIRDLVPRLSGRLLLCGLIRSVSLSHPK
jgi:hypothetical protein